MRMGAVNTTYQEATQRTLNDITQKSSAACSANCTQIQTGNVIFLSGSNVGDILFNQECTVNAQCQITQSIEAAAEAVNQAKLAGTAKPAFFLGLLQVNTDVQISKQEIVNTIKQSMDSTCNNGATQIQSNNLIYAQNSTTGDIGFTQTTDVQSQCVLSNLAKGTATATNQADLAAQAGGFGALGLGGILVLIIIIIIVIVVIVVARKKKGKEGEGGGSGGGGGAGGTPSSASSPSSSSS